MTRYHFENYDDAARYLSHARNRDKGRPLPGNCTRLRDMGTVNVTGTYMQAIGIFLYGTCVIRYLKTKSGKQYISASTGGHSTQTTYTRLNNYLPRGFNVWRIKWTDVLVDVTKWNHGTTYDWRSPPCYRSNHGTLIDTDTKKIRYEKRRAIDAVNYFANNHYQSLSNAVESQRKLLNERLDELGVQSNKLNEELREIVSLRAFIEKGDPIKGIMKIRNKSEAYVTLLNELMGKVAELQNELLFLEQKKTEHYAPEQERSVLNRV